MTTPNDPQLERIRKLLAKAEDPAVSEAEAELYNNKAAELIARYGIDRAMLADSGGSSDEITTLMIRLDAPYAPEKASLLAAIAFPLRCRTLRHTSGSTVLAATVFGYTSDVARVELLFTSLLLQASIQLTRVRPTERFGGESVSAFRRTWLFGFAAAVNERLKKAEDQAVNQAPAAAGSRSAELVVRDRATAVQNAFDAEYGNLSAARPRRLSGTGYSDGRTAGQQANLNANASLTTRRRALPRC